MNEEKLKERIISISKKLHLSHIGSCLSVLPILIEIYSKKKAGDKVILENAHSHLAELVCVEAQAKLAWELGMQAKFDAEELIKKDIHCNKEAGCDYNGGSLSHTGISIGLAIANPDKKVYTIVSDGSVCEGSFTEGLRIAKTRNITNWEIHANFNGYTATSEVDLNYWKQWVSGFGFPIIIHKTNNGVDELAGVQGHYKTL